MNSNSGRMVAYNSLGDIEVLELVHRAVLHHALAFRQSRDAQNYLPMVIFHKSTTQK
jgi:hypothetical protein